MRWARALLGGLGAAATSWLGACADYACDGDVLACEEGEAFELDATCEAEGAIEIELLEMASLRPVPDHDWPRVHHGAQGGVHFEVAVRVAGLLPDRTALRLDFAGVECRDTACEDTVVVTRRTLYADDMVLEPAQEDFLLPNVVLLLDRVPEGAGELRLDVVDACGRAATSTHRVDTD